MYTWRNFLPIFGVITLCASDPAPIVKEPVKILNVFSYTAIAQLMYKEIHKTQSYNDRQPTTDPQVKEEMCHSLTGHNRLFDRSKFERIDMSKIYEELKTEYEDIFNELYAVPSNSSPSSDKIYVNRTEEMFAYNFYDAGRFLEYVFVCLIRRISDGKLEKIYVSGEYDARHPSNAVGPLKVGRFIFRQDEHFTDPAVYGFVEEPAVVLSTSVDYLEEQYFQRKRQFRTERSECPAYMRKLNNFEINRFCNVLMNSSANDGKRRFAGLFSDTNADKCLRSRVSFRTTNARKKAMQKYYAEWTIRCLVENNDGTSAWYHVSKADEFVTEAFVFREKADHDIELENLSTAVRFIVQ